MIVEALRAARRLDETISRTAGKPYHAVLGAGLVAEIVRSARELLDTPLSNAGYARTILVIVFGLLLLTHQLGELSDRLERRRTHR